MKVNQLIVLGVVSSAPVVGVSNMDQIKKAAGQVASVLMSYYQPGRTASQGALFDRSNDPTINGFQWWEMGVWWSGIMEYSGLSGDSSHLNVAVPALTLASHREIGSFLGPDRNVAAIAQGKWNDDILWWAFAPMVGAELFPGGTMAGGVPYLQLAQRTYDEVWEQWDTASCGGGIFWSRDRVSNDPKRKFFKSTITHGQQLLLGARLYALTKDKKYLDHAELMYTWLKQGIIRPNWDIFDGVGIVDGKCALYNDIHSYNAGLMAGSLAYWFTATKDPKWMIDADNIMKRALSEFTLNGVITDPCEAVRNPTKACPINQIYFKAILIRGMGYTFRFTQDQALKTQIQSALDASAKAMFPLCDNNMVCNTQDWAAGRPGTEKNVHAQIIAMELLNAMMNINSAGLQKLQAPTAVPPSDKTDLEGGSVGFGLGLSLLVGLVALLV